MSFDPKCRELADHFLSHTADEGVRNHLAGVIQDAIEDHLESEARSAARKADIWYRLVTAKPTMPFLAKTQDDVRRSE